MKNDEIYIPHRPESFITEMKVMFKGLKATNKQQNDGIGILHQVAQFPIDQVYFVYIYIYIYIYTRHPCPSLPMQDPERQDTGC